MALNHRNKLANKDRLEHLYEFYGNTVLIDINDSITETSLFSNFFFNKFIFSGYFDLELSCRQYLIIHLMGLNFNAELLRTYNGKTITKLSYPLPVQWIRIIENRGVKVNSISCSLKFYQFIHCCLDLILSYALAFLLYFLSDSKNGEMTQFQFPNHTHKP